MPDIYNFISRKKVERLATFSVHFSNKRVLQLFGRYENEFYNFLVGMKTSFTTFW